MKKIIALNGSGRKNGNSAEILRAFLEGAKAGGTELPVQPLSSACWKNNRI